MSWGLAATAIVGYTYRTESLCPFCACRAVEEETGPGQRFDGWKDMTGKTPAIDNIAEIAQAFGFTAESEYDSEEFPKVIFASQVETDERCEICTNLLIGD